MSLIEVRQGSTVHRNMDLEQAIELIRRALEEHNNVYTHWNKPRRFNNDSTPNTWDVTVRK